VNPFLTDRSTLGATLEIVVKCLAVLTGISFAMSIVYDWGFYSGFDLTFADLPTSLADHTRGALNWTPVALISGLVFCLHFCVSKLIEKVLKIKPKPYLFSERDAFYKSRSRASYTILTLLLLFVPGSYFASGGGTAGICTALATSWAFIAMICLTLPQPTLGPLSALAITLIPAVSILIWGLGNNDALVIQNGPLSNSITYAKSEKASQVSVIRYFDKGVLLRQSDGAIVFRQWSSIEKIETRGNPFKGIVNLCTPFHWTCHMRDLSKLSVSSAIGIGSARAPGK
jgi:hypothetical protein